LAADIHRVYEWIHDKSVIDLISGCHMAFLVLG
jgi:hypothetical protein